MDNNIRYAFCIEMAQKAERNNMPGPTNAWYARAWHFLLKDSEYENEDRWLIFYMPFEQEEGHRV